MSPSPKTPTARFLLILVVVGLLLFGSGFLVGREMAGLGAGAAAGAGD